MIVISQLLLFKFQFINLTLFYAQSELMHWLQRSSGKPIYDDSGCSQVQGYGSLLLAFVVLARSISAFLIETPFSFCTNISQPIPFEIILFVLRCMARIFI